MEYPDIRREKDNQESDTVAVDMKSFYSEELIKSTPIDYVSKLVNQIKQAEAEAIKRGIRANAVAITDKLLFSKLKCYFQDIPMILGMKCMYTDELPDEVLFSVFECNRPPLNVIEQNEALKQENKELKDRLRHISEFIEEGEM